MDEFEFQLVLQLPGQSPDDYDLLTALEEWLTDALEESPHHVEGHDFGSGTGNIFIETNDPVSALALAKTVVNPTEYPTLRAGYRSFNDDDYTLIWPENSGQTFELI